MRAHLPLASSVLLAALLAGCGHAASPAALATVPAAPAAQTAVAAAPSVSVAAEAPTVTVVTAPATPADLAPTEGKTLDAAAVPALVVRAMQAVSVAEVSDNQVAKGSSSVAYNAPYQPYNLGVSDVKHDRLTLEWHTDAPSRGVVYAGYEWGFDKAGYTAAYQDNQVTTEHQIVLAGLSRFRKYRFMVMGQGPWGDQYASFAIDYRTHLFF